MKPIDRELVLEWIEICEADCAASASDFDMGMMKAFKMMREKIESGAFAVEELKCGYICPECNASNNADTWNEATRKIFGKDIGEIQTEEGDVFICPACNQEIDSGEIRFGSDLHD